MNKEARELELKHALKQYEACNLYLDTLNEQVDEELEYELIKIVNYIISLKPTDEELSNFSDELKEEIREITEMELADKIDEILKVARDLENEPTDEETEESERMRTAFYDQMHEALRKNTPKENKSE